MVNPSSGSSTLSPVSPTTTISPVKSDGLLVNLSPAYLQTILPAMNDRAILIGRTGSGKTTLAERMLRDYAYVAVLDIKSRLNWTGYARHTRLHDVMNEPHPHIIYAPEFSELEPGRDPASGRRLAWSLHLEDFFRWVYERGNTVVYNDEVMGTTNGDDLPRYYRAIMTRGRENGVGVVSATQRPTRIPQVILSESEHYFVFSIQLPQDVFKTEEIVGYSLPLLRGHEFAYAKVGSEIPPQKFVLTL